MLTRKKANLKDNEIKMTAQEILDCLLKLHAQYYTINTKDPAKPFQAEARFKIHGENYFLMKAAKFAEMNSNEHVFFALEDELDEDRLAQLDKRAWELCLERTEAKENHRNTDAILYIIAEHIDPEAEEMIQKLRHYKSYRFGLWGWNGYKIVACERSSGKTISNRLGRPLKAFFANIC